MIDFNVSHKNLDQLVFLTNYNAFIDELIRIMPKKLLKEHNISIKKLNKGICGGDVEMFAYFYHYYNKSFEEFFDFRSIFTEVLSTKEQRVKLAKAFKENINLKIKVGNTTESLLEFLHFAEMVGKFWWSIIPKKDIGAWCKKIDYIGWSGKASDLAQRLVYANILNDKFTRVILISHAVYVISDNGKFYVYDPNGKTKPIPLNTIEQIAEELTNDLTRIYGPREHCFLSATSLYFEESPEVDQDVSNIESNYAHDSKINSLITEFKAGQIAYSTLKRVVDQEEGKNAPDFDKLIDFKCADKALEFSKAINDSLILHMACLTGELLTVEWLVERGADVNLKETAGGYAPLDYAAFHNHVEVVRLLLTKGANPNSCSAHFSAAQNGKVEVVRLFLESCKEIDINQIEDEFDYSLLALAAENGHLELVELLLQKKAKVNQANKLGLTPVYGAAKENNLDIAKLLFENGAEIDRPAKDGATPLYMAAQNGHLEMVEWLLKNGAKIDITHNKTSLFWTTLENGYDEIAKLLIDKVLSDINPNQIKLAERFLKEAKKLNQIKMIERLQIKIYNQLCTAIISDDLTKVELIARSSFDINFVPSLSLQTPLYTAVSEGKFEVAKCLLANKASIDAHINVLTNNNTIAPEEASKNSLLFIAAEKNTPEHNKIVDLLLSSKYKSLFMRDKEKQNDLNVVFCYAVINGNLKMVEKLLNAGANIESAYSSKNKSQSTPCENAKCKEVTDLLDARRSNSFSFFGQKSKSTQNKSESHKQLRPTIDKQAESSNQSFQ